METTELINLEDGTVKIIVTTDKGTQIGWVSSHHLVDPKVNQLINAINKEAENAN